MSKDEHVDAVRIYNRWAGVAAAVLTVAAVWRVIAEGVPDREFLYFVLAAMVVLLGGSITKFRLGDLEFERVRELEVRVDELAEVTTDLPGVEPIQFSSPGGENGGVDQGEVRAEPEPAALTIDRRAIALAKRMYGRELSWKDDPVADLEEEGDADPKLTARVRPSSNYPDRFFLVDIELELGPRAASLGDRVAFFLHQTFPEKVRMVPVSEGTATMKLLSAGSFTVGVLLADGTTRKLNLIEADLRPLSEAQRKRFIET